MTKPLKISEQAAVQMPMKTVASLIAMVAIGTWAYFGLHESLNQTQTKLEFCLLYTSPSPRDGLLSRMPSSA